MQTPAIPVTTPVSKEEPIATVAKTLTITKTVVPVGNGNAIPVKMILPLPYLTVTM